LASHGLLDGKVAIYVSSGIFAIYIMDKQDDEIQTQSLIKSTIDVLTSTQKFGIDRVLIGYDQVKHARLGGYPGAYAILELRDGYAFTPATTGLVFDVNRNDRFKGVHGYASSHATMHTTFMYRLFCACVDFRMTGPQVKSGLELDMIRLIDIAPTVARLLDVTMPDVDGRVVDEAFLEKS
jgi:hypothetical protein